MKKQFLLLLLICSIVNLYAAKKADFYWLFLEKEPSSLYEDENVRIDYYFGGYSEYLRFADPYITIAITNKTNEMVYVDLFNSFIMRNSLPWPLYQTSTSIFSTSNTSYEGLNLGIIGLGQGTNVTHSTISTNPRIIAIPPHSRYAPKNSFHFFESDSEYIPFLNGKGQIVCYKTPYIYGGEVQYKFKSYCDLKSRILVGDIITYSESDTPLKISISVCYSFKETADNRERFFLQTTYYVNRMVGSRSAESDLIHARKDAKIISKFFPSWQSYSGAFIRMDQW